MLTHLNAGDWLSLWDNDKFIKVAKIEHKFILTGKEAQTYKKNRVEVLLIRHADRNNTTIKNGSVKHDYMIVDAETGKEISGKHSHEYQLKPIPEFKNMICEDTAMTWADMIEQQKIIYHLSDMDWKTLPINTLKKVFNTISYNDII